MGDNDRTRGLLIRRAAGGVVHYLGPQGRVFLLIRDPYGRWSLPKGHLEQDETEEQAALREVAEETSVQAMLGPLITNITYHFPVKGKTIEKRVSFFLMSASDDTIAPQIDEGIMAVGWFSASEALELLDYEQVRQVFAQALGMLERQETMS